MRKDRIIILLFLIFLSVRIVPMLVLGGSWCEKQVAAGDSDPLLYLGGAREIISSGTNSFNYFPPLNFIFIAVFLYLGKGHLLLPTLAMVMVSWLTVIAIYKLAQFLFGDRVALLSACMSGLYPDFIFFGVTFHSETLATMWVVCSFLMIVKFFRTFRYHYLVAGAILWGMASMTRAGLHYFAPVVALAILLYCLRENRRALFKTTGIFLLSTYLTIMVIGVLASPIQGDFILDSKNGVATAFHGANRISIPCSDFGHTQGNIFYDINSCREKWPPGSQRYEQAILKVNALKAYMILLQFISGEPLTYLKNSLGKLSCFWSPNQYVINYIKFHFRYHNSQIINAVCFMTALFYVIVVCGGVSGLALSRDPLRLIVILLILFYCVLIFLTVGNSKLRFPLTPFLMMYSSYALSRLAMKKVSAKKIFSNLCATAVMVIFLANSIYKYREISLSPSEALVRRVERCSESGFPETVLCLLEKSGPAHEYTGSQQERMRAASERALQELAVRSSQ